MHARLKYFSPLFHSIKCFNDRGKELFDDDHDNVGPGEDNY